MQKSWTFPWSEIVQKKKKKKRKVNINTGIKGSMLIEPYLHLAQIMIQVHMKVRVQVVPVAMIIK